MQRAQLLVERDGDPADAALGLHRLRLVRDAAADHEVRLARHDLGDAEDVHAARVVAVEVDAQAVAVIVVAGMDGALPSVVAGLIPSPVIAVPTSAGYGASFGGLSALLAMLNSCAGGVTVVNIDNGFGAAYAASLIARKVDSQCSEPKRS